jgi:hypothetical protein
MKTSKSGDLYVMLVTSAYDLYYYSSFISYFHGSQFLKFFIIYLLLLFWRGESCRLLLYILYFISYVENARIIFRILLFTIIKIENK